MIRDFSKEESDIDHMLQSGARVQVFVMRAHEVEAMDKVYNRKTKLKEQFGIDIKTLVAFGDTSEPPPSKTLRRLVDVFQTINNDNEYCRGYTCFMEIYKETGNTDIRFGHLNIKDTFNCILDKLVRPTNILILKHGKELSNAVQQKPERQNNDMDNPRSRRRNYYYIWTAWRTRRENNGTSYKQLTEKQNA